VALTKKTQNGRVEQRLWKKRSIGSDGQDLHQGFTCKLHSFVIILVAIIVVIFAVIVIVIVIVIIVAAAVVSISA
jgi:hypothetical protein